MTGRRDWGQYCLDNGIPRWESVNTNKKEEKL